MEKERVNITISTHLKDWFNAKADEIGIPMSSLMSMALDEFSKKNISNKEHTDQKNVLNIKHFIQNLECEEEVKHRILNHISKYNFLIADAIFYQSEYHPELYLLLNDKLWSFTFVLNKTYSQFIKMLDIRSVQLIEEQKGQSKITKIKLFFDANEIPQSTEDHGSFLILQQTTNANQKSSLLSFYEALMSNL